MNSRMNDLEVWRVVMNRKMNVLLFLSILSTVLTILKLLSSK